MKKLSLIGIVLIAATCFALQSHAACTVNDGGIMIPDTDCDEIADIYDNCEFTMNCDQADQDQDGVGDACDDNDDNDNIPEFFYIQDTNVNTVTNCDPELAIDIAQSDNCPYKYNPGQEDIDQDNVGDLCDDDDHDGHIDIEDNCPDHPNTNQLDRDGDGIGDTCDNCPLVYNPGQEYADDPDIGIACGDDTDLDGIPDIYDNCVFDPNPDQEDSDVDEVGDVCDNCVSISNNDQNDTDVDGVGDVCDNCFSAANGDQLDSDGDGFGDVCDNCPSADNPDQFDTDGDGIGDVCQPDPAETPPIDDRWIITGSGGHTNNCQLSASVPLSADGVAGLGLIMVALIPAVLRRRKKG